MNKKLALLGVAVLSAGILFAGCGNKDKKAAGDAAWKPTKDVKVIVAYKAGSGTDTGARRVAPRAKKYGGQPLGIGGSPGAAGRSLQNPSRTDRPSASSTCRPTPRLRRWKALHSRTSPSSRSATT